jgi:hypothetical protein
MGKIILEFDSNSERDEAQDALDAYKWKTVIFKLNQKLRETTRDDMYQGREPSEDEYNMAHYFSEYLAEVMDNYQLNLD